VSYAHGNLGAAYEASGDLPQALGEYRAGPRPGSRASASRAGKRAVAVRPGELREPSRRPYSRAREDFAGAQQAFNEDLEARRRLLKVAPADAGRIRKLATSLSYAGTLQQMTGERQLQQPPSVRGFFAYTISVEGVMRSDPTVENDPST